MKVYSAIQWYTGLDFRQGLARDSCIFLPLELGFFLFYLWQCISISSVLSPSVPNTLLAPILPVPEKCFAPSIIQAKNICPKNWLKNAVHYLIQFLKKHDQYRWIAKKTVTEIWYWRRKNGNDQLGTNFFVLSELQCFS